MPGKWTEQAERDLIFAVLASHTGGDLKMKVSWDTVKEQMHTWGHTDFTKEAMNQRWSKTIVKDFKEGKGNESFSASTPAKDTATPSRKRKTATPRATPKSAATVSAADDDDEEDSDEQGRKTPAAPTPTPKKRKPSAKKAPKTEPKAEPVPKKEEQESASIFGNGIKRETSDEA